MARRLWIFNQYGAAPDQGASTRHYDLARELVGRGWEVTIFAAGFSHFSGREERLRGWQLSRSGTFDGVEFVWLRTVPYQRNDWRRALSMVVYSVMALLRQGRRRPPTHVIGYTVHPLAALVGLITARRHRVPFFFEIGDLWPQTLIDLGAISENGLATRAMRWLERYLAEHARAVISLMPRTADYFVERGVKVRELAVIPNGVPLDEGTQSRASRAGSPVLDTVRGFQADGSFVIVYAGAHGPANGLDTVLDAAALLRERDENEIRFVLVGHGPDRERLIDRCRREDLDNVVMLPPVSKDAIRPVLAQADACLVHVTRSPVHRYGNGLTFNKPLDYMAAGRPVVFACDVPDDPVADAGAGISIQPHDPEAMAGAVLRLRDLSAAERDELGLRGRRYVAEHHDSAALARRLEVVLLG